MVVARAPAVPRSKLLISVNPLAGLFLAFVPSRGRKPSETVHNHIGYITGKLSQVTRGRDNLEAIDAYARFAARLTDLRTQSTGSYRKMSWWTMQDLNLRPLACEASALPAELIVRAGNLHTYEAAVNR
jgi:hypothetical protein